MRGANARPAAARDREHQHRPDQVRAAAPVLLRHLGRVGALLVAADRLVLDRVIGGGRGIAQGRERRQGPSTAISGLARRRSAGRRRRSRLVSARLATIVASTRRVLERQPGRSEPQSRQRDDRHRLGEPQRPTEPAGVVPGGPRAKVGFGPDATSMSRRRRGPRPPTRSGRGSGGRCGAPSRRAAAGSAEPPCRCASTTCSADAPSRIAVTPSTRLRVSR